MRKKKYTRNIGVLLSDEDYQKLVSITDILETTVSSYIRNLVENQINKKGEQQ